MAVTKDPMLRGAANLSAGAADLRLSADKEVLAKLAERELQPNRGIPLNLDWIENIRVNTSAVERRAQTLVTRRTVKKDWQVAWLLRAISCTDLTTLSGDDTDERVRRLCAKGQQPIRQDLVKLLGIESLNIRVAAICVYHSFVETAIREYAQQTGMAVGFKAAGGIRTAKQSIEWLALMKEELGASWLNARLFRLGASSMLADIERQLEFHATGRYSAEYRHPIA